MMQRLLRKQRSPASAGLRIAWRERWEKVSFTAPAFISPVRSGTVMPFQRRMRWANLQNKEEVLWKSKRRAGIVLVIWLRNSLNWMTMFCSEKCGHVNHSCRFVTAAWSRSRHSFPPGSILSWKAISHSAKSTAWRRKKRSRSPRSWPSTAAGRRRGALSRWSRKYGVMKRQRRSLHFPSGSRIPVLLSIS